jgi:hypothetical protein
VAKGKWKGLMFSIEGFGLNKHEREFFNRKRFSFNGKFTIYFLKWYLAYDNKGVDEDLSNVDIFYDKKLSAILKDKIWQFKNDLKHKLIEYRDNKKFKEKYIFTVYRSFENGYKIKANMLNAFKLANNYEADLVLNGSIIFSPLGYDYDTNKECIIKYLGNEYIKDTGFDLHGYANIDSKGIERL